MDQALKKGDVLRCAEGDYVIADIIGMGGMSVVYAATLTGSEKTYALKEYFPVDGAQQRVNGTIPLTPEQRRLAEHEKEMSQQAAQNTRRIADSKVLQPVEIVTGGQQFHPQNEGMFMLQELLSHGIRFDAMVQQLIPERQRFPHIFDTLLLIQQVLLALKQCHKNGVWFGDLHPGNVIFCDVDPQHQRVGQSVLVDFSASQSLRSDGRTVPLDTVYATPGFAAPELYEDHPRVGAQADIYSVGALLLRCLLEPEEIAAGGMTVDSRRGAEIGCDRFSLSLLNRLIDNAMAWEPGQRYPHADAMLRDVRKLMDEVERPRHLLSPNLSDPDYFLPGSREPMIEAAVRGLENRNIRIIVHGLGGIGKTEIAIQVGQRLKGIRRAYLLHWQESTRRTIETLFPCRGVALDRNDLFVRNFNILRDEYSGSVLILDNFYRADKGLDDLLSEPAFQQLQDLDVSLLLTTRYVTPDDQWQVESLSEDDLVKLMGHFLRHHREEESILRALIRQVEQHTLTVKLIAQTLEAEEGRLTGEKLLELLRSHSLHQAKMRPVSTDQNRTRRQARIYQHLQTLFDYTNLSSSQRQMMAIGCILPGGGIDVPLLRSCLTEELDEARWGLVRRGWLDQRSDKIVVHPLIAQVCREIQEAHVVADFLGELTQQCDPAHYAHELFCQSAQTLANASEHQHPACAGVAGNLYLQAGDVKAAVHYARKNVEHMERCDVKGEPYADGLCQLAEALRSAGKPEEACVAAMRALEHYEAEKDPDWQPYDIYLTLARCQNDGQCHYGAMSYLEQLEKQLRHDPGADRGMLANVLNELGNVCGCLDQYEAALGYYQEALDIYSHLPAENRPDLAVDTIVHNMGRCLIQTDPTQAMRQFELIIRKLECRYQGAPHPDLRTVYLSMAQACFAAGELDKAEAYAGEALRIMEPVLGEKHPELIEEYRVLVKIYKQKNDPAAQLQYLKLAVEAGAAECLEELENLIFQQAKTPQQLQEARSYLHSLRINPLLWHIFWDE